MPRHALPLLLVLLACRATPVMGTETKVRFERAPLGITTADGGRFALEVELAATDEQRSHGLMFRRSLGEDEGMLFVFDRDEDHTFWMKNTYLPLDMIFIDAAGEVQGILPQVPPQTEVPRSIGKRSRYVLEVNGGWCALKGVKPGDRVELGPALEKLQATGR